MPMANLDDEQDPNQLIADPSLVSPVANAADPSALRQQLYSNLLSQLNKPDPLASQRAALGDENRQNALLAALQQSANMMGTVGGRTASAAGTQQMASSLAQQGQEDLANQQQALSNKDKVQNYLLGQLDKSDNLKTQIAARQQAQQMALAQQQQIAGDKLDYKRQADQQHAELMTALQSNKLQAGGNQKQDQLYTDANKQALIPRGNMAVQNAQKGLASSQRAMELINQYPDLNKMPPSQVSLLNSEIAAIAQGGVPGEHGVKVLDNPTLASAWARLTSTVGGEPTGAQLAPFIQQNKQYLEGIAHVNQAIVNNYENSVYNGVKNRLTPEQRQQWDEDHPVSAAARKAAAGSNMVGAGPSAPAPAAVAPSDGTAFGGTNAVDPKINDYAKMHNLDYGAARSILVGRGYKPNEQ
jgi:hypothetical protein